jgi:hypothetical protein
MSACSDALTCRHAAVEPPAEYVAARTDTDATVALQAFRGWPLTHLAAIVRARREHPGRWCEARRLEAVQTAMRRVDRGRP